MTDIQISMRQVGDIVVLDMTGRLVLEEGVLPFRQQIEDLVKQGRLKFLLNLQNVTYIDSAGVGMMVAKYLSVRPDPMGIGAVYTAEAAVGVLPSVV